MTGDRLVHPRQMGILRQHEQFRRDFVPEGAQAAGAGLAPRLGHGLGEACQEDREPEPDGDRTRERRQGGVAHQQTASRENRGQDRRHLDHEHHRVGGEDARVEPAKGGPGGLSRERRAEQIDPAGSGHSWGTQLHVG